MAKYLHTQQSSEGSVALGLARRIAILLVVLLVAVGVGLSLSSLPKLSTTAWLLGAPALIAFGFLVARGPRWCLAGLIASVVFGLSNSSVSVGAIDLRLPDLFLVALLVWAIRIRGRTGQRGWLNGRRLLAVWLAVLGFSLYPLMVSGTIDTSSIVGWARLVATFSLVWLVPYTIDAVRDVEFVLGTIALCTTAEVGRAVLNAVMSGKVGSRLVGAYNPNTMGLLAALVLVLALHGPVPRQRILKATMVIVGVSGLLMSRSLGSTAAAVFALGVYGVQVARSRRDGTRQQLVVPTRMMVLIGVGFAVAAVLRPTNLPTSPSFGHSTTVQRAILADAGLEVFSRDPVFGVGWQHAPEVIASSPAVNDALRARFRGANPDFFPGSNSSGEVHNAYIQVLAEAGLIGFSLLLALLITMGRGIALVLRSVRSQPRLYVAARAAVVLLIVPMIWWNDNTLYGAQPESILVATCLGLLAAVPVLARRDDAPVAVND